MATVKLSDIESMVDNKPISKVERLAMEFLEVFEPDRPLDQEEFEEWITDRRAFSRGGKGSCERGRAQVLG